MTSAAQLKVVICTCSCGRKFTEVPAGATRMNSGAFFSHWFTCDGCGSGNIAVEKDGRMLSDMEGRNEINASTARIYQKAASSAFKSTTKALGNVRPIRPMPHGETASAINSVLAEGRKAAGVEPSSDVVSDNRAVAKSAQTTAEKMAALVVRLGGQQSEHEKLSTSKGVLLAIADEAMRTSTTADCVEDVHVFLNDLQSTISEVTRLLSGGEK